jgi:hypothetical protein
MKPTLVISLAVSILLGAYAVVPALAEKAGSDLKITRIVLRFGDHETQRTVARRQEGLQAFADIDFTGSGLFEGCWMVDDKFLADIAQYVTGPGTTRIASPATPGLPTIVEGLHIVALVVQTPVQLFTPARIGYFVTTDIKSLGQPIVLTDPPDSAAVDPAVQAFAWEDNPAVKTYLVEFIDDDPDRPVMSAFTEALRYNLPVAVARYKFIPGRTYFWQVKGFSADHKRVSASFPRQFRMAGGIGFNGN